MPEVSGQHPIWEGAVVGFLFAAEHGLVPPEEIIPTMGQVCLELMQQGMLADLGELQAYLRNRSAFVQLVAQPFVAEQFSQPGIKCIDMLTGETKGHWLMVSVSADGSEVKRQLKRLGISDHANEALLAYDTGMLII